MSAKSSFLSFLIFPLILIASPARAGEPRFVDAETYFSSTELGRVLLPAGFKAIEANLDEQFANACPDSFCEGVVANWAPLGLHCSVDQENHVVGECSWSFAGSFEDVDPRTGKITIFHENRTCELAFEGSSGRLAEFLIEATAAKGHAFGLLTAKIPGRENGLTLFDLLNACL